MRYWSISAIANNPLMYGPLGDELMQFYRKAPSQDAYHAAMQVTRHMEPVNAPHLVIIESDGTPSRRVYTEYPDLDEWLHLERAAVMENNGYTFLLMDALH